MLISIIIITFNRSKELLECIESIFKQEYQNYEIIIVDQNSPDNTRKVVNNIKDERIKYFYQHKNLGVAGGRNFGIKNSKGEIVIHIDDDAEFEKTDSLTTIIKIFSKYKKVGVIAFDIKNYFNKKVSNFGYSRYLLNLRNAQRSFIVPNFIGCGHAFRREVYKAVGGYNEKYFFWGEEGELSIRLYSATEYYILFVPQVVVLHKIAINGRINWKEGRYLMMFNNKLDLISTTYYPLRKKYFSLIIAFISLFVKSIKYGTLNQFSLSLFIKYLLGPKNKNTGFIKFSKIKRLSFTPYFYNKLADINNFILDCL